MQTETIASRQGPAVLLIEDDLAVARTLTDVLEGSGYRVWHVENGQDARAMLEHQKPDLIVLDLMLPDVDGLVLCSALKALTDAPIIICSASNQTRERVLGLKLGADDFISKPFDVYEFEARVEAVLRRSQHAPAVAAPQAARTSDQMHIGDLTVDRSRRRVTLGGEALQLTPTEYRLLVALTSRPDEVLSREELAQLVWGYQDVSNGRTIDVHIRRLRVKLTNGTVAAPPIISVRGFGYKISPVEADVAGAI